MASRRISDVQRHPRSAYRGARLSVMEKSTSELHNQPIVHIAMKLLAQLMTPNLILQLIQLIDLLAGEL